MSAIIKLDEKGVPLIAYKCRIKGCGNPENPEVGVRCSFCSRGAHLNCTSLKGEENLDQINEWYCSMDCGRKAEKNRFQSQLDSMLKAQEASRKIIQSLTDKIEAKEKEDERKKADLQSCLERIRALEEENRRLSQLQIKPKLLSFEKSTNLNDTVISNVNLTDEDALKTFADQEDDADLARRLTEIFKKPAVALKDSSVFVCRGKSKEEIDEMSETEKLAYYQRLHVQRLDAPKLMRYSGDPAEWLSFRASYERMKERGEYDNFTVVDKLREALSGEAERYVKPRLNQPFADAEQIMEALRKRFFQPKEAVAKAWEKLENWTQIPDKNRKSLENFLVEIDSYIFLCGDLGFKPELEIAINSRITNKLPYAIESKWHSYVSDKGIRGNIVEFSQFMWSFVPNLPSREMSNEVGGNTKGRASVNVVQKDEEKFKSFGARKAKREKPDCWYCGKDKKHALVRCEEFRKLSYLEKTKFLATNKICDRCLSSSQHSSSTCPRIGRIAACARRNCTNKMSHSTIMHPPSCDGARYPSQNSDAAGTSQSTLLVQKSNSTLFKVVPVYVYDGHGKRVETTLLMDAAAGASLVNMEFYNRLDIPGKKCSLELSWLDPSAKHADSSAFLHDLTISPVHDPEKKIHLRGMTAMPNIILPAQEQHAHVLKAAHPHLKHADIPSFSKQRPQILLGLPHARWMVTFETLVDFSKDSAPIAEKTPLGWTVCGSSDANKSIFHCCRNDQDCTHKEGVNYEEESLQQLHELVRYFHSFEALGVSRPDEKHLTKEDRRAEEIKGLTMRRVGDRYEIGHYWSDDNAKLPNNYGTALKRLKSTEARLRHLGMVDWAIEHHRTMRESGFARLATESDLNPAIPHKRINYVPGFVVFNMNKMPVKPRWVIDSASRHEGVSLNSRLLKGVDNLVPLTQALFHFRERKFAVVSDVTKMFHQIKIRADDQQVQRFLWRDCDDNIEPRIYIFENMLFGVNSSPSQANAVRIDHAEKSADKFPEASRVALDSMFMDDAFDSQYTESQAIDVARQTINMFREISWNMVDFRSNSETVLKQLPHENVDSDLLLDLTSGDELATRKVLGLFWHPQLDVFKFQMVNNSELLKLSLEHDYHPTKREILSFVMKIFDCLGLVSHFTIRGRMVLQEIWRKGIAWEQKIPQDIHETWLKWLQKFEEVQRLEIPRHYGLTENAENVSLHIFVDASLEAYCAVAYLRFKVDGCVKVALIMAKTRVAPVKYASVPKLELMAAVVGARMMRVIREQHKRLEIKSVTFWSDSITVLRWLYSTNLRLQQFVAPRVTEIQEITCVNDWRYIRSDENVADDGTKWNDIDFSSANHRWFAGVDFLYDNEENWPPKFPVNINLQPLDVLLARRAEKLDMEDKLLYYGGIFQVSPSVRANWTKYVTTVAWVLRFKQNLVASVRGMKLKKDALLEPEELNMSEKLIFGQIQKAIFRQEIKDLRRGMTVAQSSSLFTLNPFLDGDLIRARTRMYKELEIPYDMRCPIILPNRHETVHSFLQHLHLKNKHIGVEATIAESRSRAWIIHARKAVKRVKHQCLYCIEVRARNYKPPAGQIPSCRLDVTARPFEHVGVDLAGSFTIYAGKSYVKKEVYIALFTCLKTRAVFLRKLDSLTADELLLAIQEVHTRRGPIRTLYSDNAKNNVGAANIINAEHHKHLAEARRINWVFLPPLTPHWAGVYERLIRDVKRALYSEMKKKIIRERVFECALLQIEDIMNSRPLTHLPANPDDLLPLTPNYLVKLHPGYDFVGGEKIKESDGNHCTLKAHKISKKLSERWLREYIPVITRADSRKARNDGIKEGDFVIYTDPTARPSDWKRGIVVNIYTGRDGFARVADIKLLNGEIVTRRSAARLAKLKIDDESFNKLKQSILVTDFSSLNHVSHVAQQGVCNNSKQQQRVSESRGKVSDDRKINLIEFKSVKSLLESLKMQSLSLDEVISLLCELSDAEFVRCEEIADARSGVAVNLAAMKGDERYEDFDNKRTVRIRQIDKLCCFMTLIGNLANHQLKVCRVICDSYAREGGYYAAVTFETEEMCDRAVSLGKLSIAGREYIVNKTFKSMSFAEVQRSEFTCITWPEHHDHIILGRRMDGGEPLQNRAVPVLSVNWKKEYDLYMKRVNSMALGIAARQIKEAADKAASAEPVSTEEVETESDSEKEESDGESPRRIKPKLKSVIVRVEPQKRRVTCSSNREEARRHSKKSRADKI